MNTVKLYDASKIKVWRLRIKAFLLDRWLPFIVAALIYGFWCWLPNDITINLTVTTNGKSSQSQNIGVPVPVVSNTFAPSKNDNGTIVSKADGNASPPVPAVNKTVSYTHLTLPTILLV